MGNDFNHILILNAQVSQGDTRGWMNIVLRANLAERKRRSRKTKAHFLFWGGGLA